MDDKEARVWYVTITNDEEDKKYNKKWNKSFTYAEIIRYAHGLAYDIAVDSPFAWPVFFVRNLVTEEKFMFDKFALNGEFQQFAK